MTIDGLGLTLNVYYKFALTINSSRTNIQHRLTLNIKSGHRGRQYPLVIYASVKLTFKAGSIVLAKAKLGKVVGRK